MHSILVISSWIQKIISWIIVDALFYYCLLFNICPSCFFQPLTYDLKVRTPTTFELKSEYSWFWIIFKFSKIRLFTQKLALRASGVMSSSKSKNSLIHWNTWKCLWDHLKSLWSHFDTSDLSFKVLTVTKVIISCQ